MLKTKIWLQFTFGLQVASFLGHFPEVLGWFKENTDSCQSNEFECYEMRKCILKHKWCNENYDCGNSYSTYNYDEQYCNTNDYYVDHDCDKRKFYQCDNGECIPISGRCDGLPSCRDGSDEYDCKCEELLGESNDIKFKAYSGWKRYLKCWNIEVPPNKYLKLIFKNLSLKTRVSSEIEISVQWKNSLSQKEIIHIYPHNQKNISTIEAFDDTEISFHSVPDRNKRISPGESFDYFSFNYIVADMLCKRSDVIRCSSYSCIVPEKKCDGIRDCANGIDEFRCEKGVFTVEGVNASRELALSWLTKQRNAAWGWRENTHRAVVAMYLAQGANFNGTNKEEELTAKQLELRMSTAILRNGTDLITPTQLSMYINALLAICHDPRNFYGYNLVEDLKKRTRNSMLVQPLSYLALCNAKEQLSDNDVEILSSILISSSDHSFLTDVQAVAVIALSCIANQNEFSYVKENITTVTNILKERQLEDGSFGSIYTTALVLQALISSGNEEDKDWNLKAAVQFLIQKQNILDSGSFGDFLATYLILPILNGKSLADISKVNCTEKLKMPRDGNPVSDIELKLGKKISVHYSLYIGDNKDQEHPIFLRVPENITVLEVMRLAEEADPKYKFQYQIVLGKINIFKISEIANDPEDGKFWLLFIKPKNSSLVMATQGADTAIVSDDDKVVMWYKSADVS